MDSDSSWIRITRSSSRRLSARSSDAYIVGDDDYYESGEEESRPEYLCPFCAEDFDIVGLCCHIDEEHPVEAKNGICPVCAKRVGAGLIDHVTVQHGSLLRVQRKRRSRLGGSTMATSALSILKKELREGNLQSLRGGFSNSIASSTQPDSLLSSFIFNPPAANETPKPNRLASPEASSLHQGSTKNSSERSIRPPLLSEKDHEERSQRCEFVRGLLLSTFLDDDF